MINNGLLEILMLAQHKADARLWLHSKRVACYAVEIAKVLNQSPEFRRRMLLSGLVHDIGFLKIDVDFSQLSIETLLHNDDELIKQHVLEGVNLLSKILSDVEILDVVKHHHEKFNGEGFPDQLKGEAISLGARILAVADLYDSMMVGGMSNSDRAVPESVMHYLGKTASGTILDPIIVNVFLDILQKNAVFYLSPDENDLHLYKIVYLAPGKLELGDLCDQYGTVLVKQGAELTNHMLGSIRSKYPGQKIIYVPQSTQK